MRYSVSETFIASFEKRAALKVPKFFSKAVSGGTGSQVMKGLERASTEHGPESFVMAIPAYLANKVVGKNKVNKAMWNYVSKPAMIADTAVGHVLGKIPGAKKLFTQTEKVPWGNKPGMFKEVSRSSALAPLGKGRDFVAPILVASGAERGLKALKKKPEQDTRKDSIRDGIMKTPGETRHTQQVPSSLTPQLREKVASTMLRLNEANKEHEKRARAIKLMYKQAEAGVEAVPQTYSDFEEKVASLVGQDLAVLEKALELSSGEANLGNLTEGSLVKRSAEETFQNELLYFS